MATVKTRIRIGADGSLSGQAVGLPTGEHEAEISIKDGQRQPVVSDVSTLIARIRAIQDEVARLPVRDNRDPDEIIGYNDRGHFD